MSTLLNQTMQKHLEIPVKKSIIANSEKKKILMEFLTEAHWEIRHLDSIWQNY